MPSDSQIVDLLAALPTEELETLRNKTKSTRDRADVELQQIEEALARRSPVASRALGSTRKRVLAFIAQRGPARPADVHAGLREEGGAPSGGAIHNMLGRLVKEGDLERVGDGYYKVASRNGSGSEEIEGTEPLSTATDPQQASND
jgi:hypothetical protein